MAKDFVSYTKKLVKKGDKGFKKGSKKLSKQLFGKKSLSFEHSYNNSISVFADGKDKKPLFSASVNGDYRISLFKLIAILMCIVSTGVLIGLAVRGISERMERRRFKKRRRDEEYYDCEDELQF